MRELVRDSRFWIRKMENLFFFGLGFSLVWCFLMTYMMEEDGAAFGPMLEYIFSILTILYAVNDVGIVRYGTAQSVISQNGTRKGIIRGTMISDTLFCIQSTGTYALLHVLLNGGGNLKELALFYLLCFIFMQGFGYLLGLLGRRFGKILMVSVNAVMMGIIFFIMGFVINSSARYFWVSEAFHSNKILLFGLLVMAILLNVTGKICSYHTIKKLEVEC